MDNSSLLLVNGRSNKHDLSSSFLAATLTQSLLQEERQQQDSMIVIPLAYFCSQHVDYTRDVAAQPSEMVMSLLLQLIDGYAAFSAADLQALNRLDPHSIDSVCAAFGSLVAALPTTVTVYLIIEGVSRFSAPAERQRGLHHAVECLVSVHRQQKRATLKMAFMTATRARDLEDLFEEDEILNAPTIPQPRGCPALNVARLYSSPDASLTSH